MSVEINKSNYEAFYLDYLEGNLHGEALAAFEAFMAENPELAIEDTDFVSLITPEETMDPVEKLAMKRTVDISALSLETVDYFLIARTEGLLSAEEDAQLENWLSANAYYRNDAKLYALTQLQADPQEVFTGKAALKRKPARVIPLWVTGLSIAAGLALLITVSIPKGTEPANGDNGNPIAQQTVDSTQNNQQPNGNQNVTAPNGPTNRSTSPDKQGGYHKQQPGTPEQQPIIRRYPAPDRRNETAYVAPLDKRQLHISEHQQNELAQWNAPEITPKQSATADAPSNNDVAWEPVKMTNPIEPVTKTLASTLDTPVDFRTAKATKKKPGGFYLRIGKLEVSHRSASL